VSAAGVAGFGLGFAVAAQVGPVSLLCVRSVLRGRFVSGLAIGGGAAAIDVSYAALGITGTAGVLHAFPQLGLALGLAGAAVLVVLGVRTLYTAVRVRSGLETAEEVGSPRRALVTALIATASNPLTIAYWAAVFTASSAAHLAGGTLGAAMFLAGIGLGTLTWFAVLSAAAGVGRRRLGPRAIRWIDAGSGLGTAGFGGLLGWRSVHGH
jgi:threonine/homoserine/homoserine lactone efflux protein